MESVGVLFCSHSTSGEKRVRRSSIFEAVSEAREKKFIKFFRLFVIIRYLWQWYFLFSFSLTWFPLTRKNLLFKYVYYVHQWLFFCGHPNNYKDLFSHFFIKYLQRATDPYFFSNFECSFIYIYISHPVCSNFLKMSDIAILWVNSSS